MSLGHVVFTFCPRPGGTASSTVEFFLRLRRWRTLCTARLGEETMMRKLTSGMLGVALIVSGCSRAATAKTPEAASDAASAPAQTATPAAAPRASSGTWHDVTIPAGTTLPIVLDTAVGSDIRRLEQAVRAHVARPTLGGGRTVVPSR